LQHLLHKGSPGVQLIIAIREKFPTLWPMKSIRSIRRNTPSTLPVKTSPKRRTSTGSSGLKTKNIKTPLHHGEFLCDYIAISAPRQHKASPGLMLPGSHYNTSLDAKLVTKTNSCTVKV